MFIVSFVFLVTGSVVCDVVYRRMWNTW